MLCALCMSSLVAQARLYTPRGIICSTCYMREVVKRAAPIPLRFTPAQTLPRPVNAE